MSELHNAKVALRSRLLPALLAVLLAACVREPQAEPPRSPDDPLILPSWAEQGPPSPEAYPKGARPRESITLGESHAPSGASESRAAEARSSSTQHKFPANDTWGPYRPLYYRSMPPTYVSPGPGTSSPSKGDSRTPPIGRDWPAIPDHGPKFPFTTPVHP